MKRKFHRVEGFTPIHSILEEGRGESTDAPILQRTTGNKPITRRRPPVISLLLGQPAEPLRQQDEATVLALAQFIIRSAEASVKQARRGFPASAHETAGRDALIEEIELLLREETAAGLSRKSDAASIQRVVLETVFLLSELLQGEKPTIYQVLGLLALRPDMDGMVGPLFRAAVNYIRYRSEQSGGEQTYWVGSIENFYHGFNIGLPDGRYFPQLVLEVLGRDAGEILTSEELLARLPEELPAMKCKRFSNPVLQFLNAAGAVLRHPDHKDSVTKKMIGTWSISEAVPKKPALASPEMLLLHHVALGSGWLSELYQNGKYPGAGAEFSHHAIMHAARELKRLGVLELRKESLAQSGGANESGNAHLPRTRAFLTDRARSIVVTWADIPVGERMPESVYERLRRTVVAKHPL